MLYSSLILEDEAQKHTLASSLGEFHCFGVEDRAEFEGDVKFAARATRCWNYYCKLEHRWNRQPGTGRVPFT